MSDEESTSRTAVKTYVPAYQKDVWRAHAEDLDMSQSEFVRTMVQAGRRHYSADAEPTADAESSPTSAESASTEGLSDRIEALLVRDGPLSWDELLAELTDDIETRLDDSLEELQASNTIKYSGRDDGYTVVDS